MKKLKQLAFFAPFILIVCSCSAVFDAGVSGRVYYVSNGSEYSIANAKVFVYDSPSLEEPIASTRTNANGDYTVNRIVWKTGKGAFGKTADYHTVYIYVEHEDFEIKADYVKAKIISDSTNAGMADVEMTRVRYTVPSFSGRITSDIDASVTSDYDEVEVWLCYKEDGNYVRFTDSEAKTATAFTQTGSDSSPWYMHGGFSGLGGGNMKYSKTDYPELWVVADLNKDGTISTGDLVSVASYEIDVDAPNTLRKESFETY